MKLVASMIVHNELDRYLPIVIETLLEHVDEIRVVDDHSTDGTADYLRSLDRVAVLDASTPFYAHEGRARQRLLEWTLDAGPTHVLAIDGDELLLAPPDFRSTVAELHVGSLCMEEAWQIHEHGYDVRCDGGWCPHPIPAVYLVPGSRSRQFRIADRALACGREPEAVRQRASSAIYTGAVLVHLGWANPTERQRRFNRYAKHDGGRFHANSHLQSILWDDDRVVLETRGAPGPPAPASRYWAELVEQANADRAAA